MLALASFVWSLVIRMPIDFKRACLLLRASEIRPTCLTAVMYKLVMAKENSTICGSDNRSPKKMHAVYASGPCHCGYPAAADSGGAVEAHRAGLWGRALEA